MEWKVALIHSLCSLIQHGWISNFSFLLIKVTFNSHNWNKMYQSFTTPKFYLAALWLYMNRTEFPPCTIKYFSITNTSSLHPWNSTTIWSKYARNSIIGSIFKGLRCNYVQYTKFVKQDIHGLRPLLLFHSNLDLNIINLQIWNKSIA